MDHGPAHFQIIDNATFCSFYFIWKGESKFDCLLILSNLSIMGSKNANEKNQKDKRKKVKDNLSSKHSAPSDGNVINDPRFAKAHTDPRFREAPKRETKVAIDSRFNRMFTHKSFLPSSAPVDKRGKAKNKPTSQLGSMRHYYKIDEKETEQSSDEEEEIEEELVKANRLKTKSDKDSELEETSESESSAKSEETSESESATDTDTDTDEGANEEDYEEEESDVQVLYCLNLNFFIFVLCDIVYNNGWALLNYYYFVDRKT